MGWVLSLLIRLLYNVKSHVTTYVAIIFRFLVCAVLIGKTLLDRFFEYYMTGSRGCYREREMMHQFCVACDFDQCADTMK